MDGIRVVCLYGHKLPSWKKVYLSNKDVLAQMSRGVMDDKERRP